MKVLSKLPYLENISKEYNTQFSRQEPNKWFSDHYRQWLMQFGFKVPAKGNYLEFLHEYTEHDLLLFTLKWS
jgi:hypothetical protein